MNNFNNLKIEEFKKHPIIHNLVDWELLKETTKNQNIKLLDFIGKGHRGVVFKGLWYNNDNTKYQHIALKVPRVNSKNTIINEATIMMETNKFGVAPIVYNYSENFLMMELLEGVNLKDYLKQDNIDKRELLQIIRQTMKQCLKLDLHKIDHTEIQGGKHIIINRENNNVIVKLLDFDKAKKQNKPHNFTGAISLFYGKCYTSKKIKEILNIPEKDYVVVRELLKIYKNTILKI
ncbi:protein kinase [Methanococcus aeolicus]|uniref:protein kinase n=1 Tax=Methanococcus aeolicus TaxID=42879 RepID=UPI0021C9F190|nr:protein kinase [Methanococcus aeolicus]UXM84072.1 protein kinase [Methanococcus aeolicus]